MIEKTVLAKLVEEETLFSVFSPYTKHPFLYCNPDSQEDQIFLYSSVEKVREAIVSLNQQGYLGKDVLIEKENRRKFFIDLRLLGVSEIVFDAGDGIFTFGVEELLQHPLLIPMSGWPEIPDWDKFPKEKKPLVNASLQTTISYMFQEQTRKFPPGERYNGDYKEEFEVNLLRNQFAVPIVIETVEGEDAQGNPNKRVGYVIYDDKEGNHWIPIFSDSMEFRVDPKITKPLGRAVAPLKTHLAQLPKECKGFLLNPNSVGIMLSKEHVEKLFEIYDL